MHIRKQGRFFKVDGKKGRSKRNVTNLLVLNSRVPVFKKRSNLGENKTIKRLESQFRGYAPTLQPSVKGTVVHRQLAHGRQKTISDRSNLVPRAFPLAKSPREKPWERGCDRSGFCSIKRS